MTMQLNLGHLGFFQDAKREQLEALHVDLKRPASGDKKLSFHPTQTSVTNMLADVRQLGLRPLFGAKFDLRTIHLLAEIQVPPYSTLKIKTMCIFIVKNAQLHQQHPTPPHPMPHEASRKKLLRF